MTAMTNIAELELSQLEVVLEDLGAKPYHARQMYRWLYRRGITDFGQMTDLSVPLRQRLEAMAVVQGPTLAERLRSTDGTEKFLIAMHDGRHVESVFIPDTPRQTLCISTQVGCAMHCAFCLTGKMGLLRNLSAGEIVGQVRLLAHAIGLVGSRFNIVLMGMGEPLHNYDATMKALRMLTDKNGFAVEPGWITLSTIGVPHALERLSKEPLVPNLAVSLHAATEELRAELVPVNHKYKLADVVEACRQFPVGRRRRITFEYTLLDGVNDSADDAVGLARLLAGFQSKAKVNVIPLNEAPGIPYRRPSDDQVDRFARRLSHHGVTVSVRKSRGRDIRAACGQLIVEGDGRSPAQRLAAQLPDQNRTGETLKTLPTRP